MKWITVGFAEDLITLGAESASSPQVERKGQKSGLDYSPLYRYQSLMKIYRHYKDKLYKFIGTAKHSETLEEVAVYYCHYDNPSGQLWIRPKEMFFGKTEVNGHAVQRFANLPIEIKTTTNISAADWQQIEPLMGNLNVNELKADIADKRHFLAIARIEGEAVGFKLGYQKTATGFFAWPAIIDKPWRGCNVARTLNRSLRRWCREQKYKTLESSLLQLEA